jgi:hypothetical protein
MTQLDPDFVFNPNAIIRTMVRSGYDLQGTRIQCGARITATFKLKLGQKPDGMTEAQLASEDKKILETLRENYKRITDGIVMEGRDYIEGKLPTQKKFVPAGLITEYAELIMVDQYMTLLSAEDQQFNKLEKLLKGIPIYDNFLSQVVGCGRAMSAVIISEIDIHKAEYPSSLHKYAGLDVCRIGKYTDELGKEHTVPADEIDAFYDENDPSVVYMAHGRYPCVLVGVGRSKKDYCLVQKEYTTAEGNTAFRSSITFSPFLKTKLIGVLGGSFLKAGKILVEGIVIGGARRLEMAETLGFKKPSGGNAESLKNAVLEFLEFRGYEVKIQHSNYGKIYYDYKFRIQNMPEHMDKSDGHRHNMAVRYAVKRFLIDLYSTWRALEGLPVAEEYSIAKLGMVHGKAGGGKPTL